ncbi:DNA primase [Alkalidesulfovibrio alkalitolerans DSM 16529]|uniref:DNA primase n=1 Tax=Alkalidesulfovibrio alkalitolerans DSM 16529 TaxID=1121439 RepID=S7UDR0_9BACT|nr:DNA primase [Alkalidesulfovibrio alkalitolerans]EPR30348.1 DNA primase [Alkalidesulfovibrio alkalitolerans DSM 16529]
MGYDSGVIQELKSRLDLVEVVRRYVELRPAAGGRWMGPCPFHQETKGSFSVNQDLGFYYCFGCQATGDVIDFYGRINGLEFRDAVEALAAEAGVRLKALAPDPKADERRKLKNVCIEMHRVAQDYFRSTLNRASGRTVRDYLSRRSATPEVVERFGLGASLNEWEALKSHLSAKGFSEADGVAAGLYSKNDAGRVYDRFRGRLIFPIQDLAGKVIAFGGRVVDPKDTESAKYLNSSDSPIYKKGEHLYGLFQARPSMARSRRALLTEGYMDVLSLHQFGFADAVGVLGTALTPEQVRRLAGFCKRVDLVFDGDAPGRKAALKSAEMILGQGLACSVVLLPDGQDVDDLLKARGREGFAACLDEARDGLDFCLTEVRATGSAREVMEWARAFLSGLRERDWLAWYLPRVAEGLGLDEATLRRGFMTMVKGGGKAGAADAADAAGNASRSHGFGARHGGVGAESSAADRQLLAFVVLHPECWREFRDNEYDLVLESDWGRSFWEKIRDNGEGGYDTLLHLLDEDEKRFFGEKSGLPQHKGEAFAKAWEEMTRGLAAVICGRRRRHLQEALREAARRNDHEEVLRLTTALNDAMTDMCGRLNEQS